MVEVGLWLRWGWAVTTLNYAMRCFFKHLSSSEIQYIYTYFNNIFAFHDSEWFLLSKNESFSQRRQNFLCLT